MKPYHEETVFKPLSKEEAAIANASPGDLLLFLIALNRREQGLDETPKPDTLQT